MIQGVEWIKAGHGLGWSFWLVFAVFLLIVTVIIWLGKQTRRR